MTATVPIGVFLWTDRNYVDGEWVDGTNKLHLAGPHDVFAGWPSDLFEDPDTAPSYHPIVSEVAELVAAEHPEGEIESQPTVNRDSLTNKGTYRKLGEIVIDLDDEIIESTFDPCPECRHHIDAYDEEPAAPEGHHGITYECDTEDGPVYHLGFGRHD